MAKGWLLVSRILPTVVLIGLAACKVAPDPSLSTPLSPSAIGAPGSLKTVPVPSVPGIEQYVVNKAATVALGKALFWDQATGSDGLACASCHFQAGADNRVKNQLDPGLAGGDTSFQRMAFGAGGPNYTLKTPDFPFHKFSNPDDRNSTLVSDTNDVASSQGVYNGTFTATNNTQTDICNRAPDAIFHVGGIGTRKVEPRNTPTTINAALYFRNFWDGRANNVFNGVDPFGLRNAQASVLRSDGSRVKVDLRNSSLASQGVGPAVSDLEMICSGRQFAAFGRKMIPRQALSLQTVAANDSVLAPYRNLEPGAKGLAPTYEQLIKAAFSPVYWDAPPAVPNTAPNLEPFTQMETNFSLFWGLALQAYQATLISDQAPYDSWAEGNSAALSASQLAGLDTFLGKGKCINCHVNPEFSSAASYSFQQNQAGGLVERMLMGDGAVALYDAGFYNIGVTRTASDLGVGEQDPWGNPLSFSRQYTTGRIVDPVQVNPCSFEIPFKANNCAVSPPNLAGERVAVDGAFKTPTLRNVELTGPFFHDGSSATLEQVVQHYNRGGNFRNPELDPDIVPLGLSGIEQANLVAFMKTLTDDRVRYERAPFDHPQLFIPNGHPGDQALTQGGEFGQTNMALSEWLEVPAVGSSGRATPIKDFATALSNGGPGFQPVRRFDPGNKPPVLDPLADRVNALGTRISTKLVARDPNGNRIFYSASGLPTGLKLNSAGSLSGQLSEVGEFVVTVLVHDQQLGTTTVSFTWTVTAQ